MNSGATVWNSALDSDIRARRYARESWDSIAVALNIKMSSVRERGRRLLAKMGPPPITVQQYADLSTLFAGSSITWDTINAGTCLAGEPISLACSTYSEPRECQFIEGEPAGKHTVYCCAPTITRLVKRDDRMKEVRGPYCQYHTGVAYVSSTVVEPIPEQVSPIPLMPQAEPMRLAA